MGSLPQEPFITSIAHINITVPAGTLDQAHSFYGNTLGLTSRPVPHLQKHMLAWFDIGTSGQQVHVAHGAASDFEGKQSSRHPCFKLGSGEKLLELRRRIYEHFERGGDGAPREADKPGAQDSGSQGVEYPQRFFARDFAGNRLEFST